MNAILVDFGSTFTKMTVVDIKNKRLLFTAKSPSTVSTHALTGLERCIDQTTKALGHTVLKKSVQLSSSSAAGGLRMVIIGLTQDISMLAGKNAALGAGARVIKAYNYTISQEDIKDINAIAPEIILLCGGTDGGNRDNVICCAELLARYMECAATVVYAGNAAAARECLVKLRQCSKECIVTENIYPDLGILNIEPVTKVIREVFMERIVNMKGLGEVRKIFGDIIMPTPMAVLEGGRLLSAGTGATSGMGELMIVDIGGATTDVHSYCTTKQEDNIRISGIPEPFSKRTVEGDLGVRSSAVSLFVEIKRYSLQYTLPDKNNIGDSINYRTHNPAYIPDSPGECTIDTFLSMGAVHIAARRHAGYRTNAYYKGSCVIQKGKNLKGIKAIIGTGGPIINSSCPQTILNSVFTNNAEGKDLLLPSQAKLFLDSQYILYAAGLLSHIDADAALHILKDNLQSLS